MSKLWTDQGRARMRETRRREFAVRQARRRKKVETVKHPLKAAKKRWLW